MSNTIESIAINVEFSACLGVFSFAAFSLAVKFGYNWQIAPRTAARPKNVIKNVLSQKGWMSWLPYCITALYWAMSLDYKEMLQGIPGTGTRQGGEKGTLLKCNLDGIIIVKYHALCFRVAMLATFFCMSIILPMNLMVCRDHDENIMRFDNNCSSLNLTDYGETTVSHLPSLRRMSIVNSELGDVDDNDKSVLKLLKQSPVFFFNPSHAIIPFYVIVVVAWIIYCYACRQIWNEWVDNLALRKAYYFEFDHFAHRKNELLKLVDDDDDEEEDPPHHRPPYIPHPELRETVPNVCLYSVLYKLPQRYYDKFQEHTMQTIDRQLAATINFFDKCVPNQPGYSSSVAAVTILPNSKRLAVARKLWYKSSKKLRRLRFIRSRLQQLRGELGKQNDDNGITSGKQLIMPPSKSVLPTHDRMLSLVTEEENLLHEDKASDSIRNNNEEDNYYSANEDLAIQLISPSPPPPPPTNNNNNEYGNIIENLNNNISKSMKFKDIQKKSTIKYSRGLKQTTHKIELPPGDNTFDLIHSDDGIEQLSVYAREFSHSSKGCCPYGCNTKKIINANICELEDLEEEAEEELRNANRLLLESRKHEFKKEETIEPAKYTNALSRELSCLNAEANYSEDSWDNKHDVEEANREGKQKNTKLENEISCWNVANGIAMSERSVSGNRALRKSNIPTGKWTFSLRSFSTSFSTTSFNIPGILCHPAEYVAKSVGKCMGDKFGESAYAVVTFTSRQAAIAARQCLADASTGDRWQNIEDIPVPPLADTVPLFGNCRECCRPVTLKLTNFNRRFRKYCVIILVIFISLFYTAIFSAIGTLLTKGYDKDSEVFIEKFIGSSKNISGVVSGLLTNLFITLCPFIFKGIANFGGGATSLRQAELTAIRYFWYFYLIIAFVGSSLGVMLLKELTSTKSTGVVEEILKHIAETIPTIQSGIWLNWIILRSLGMFPLNYFFRVAAVLFSMFGMKCCARLMAGGGPGGPLPMRMYVDSGLVFLCIVALSPVCPLIAPFGFIYFLLFTPILRWLLIFVYRPDYDGGGLRWPLIHEMLISAMIVAQVLLCAMLSLKGAFGPGVFALLSVVPTLIFNSAVKERFSKSYEDAGLLQTSQLDGWDTNTTESDREEFRSWLVDCHKASFVPVCIAGLDNLNTAAPAVVLPDEKGVDTDDIESDLMPNLHLNQSQRGAYFRRIPSLRSKRNISSSIREERNTQHTSMM